MIPPPNSFATTRWTRVVAARGTSPEAKQALSDLCTLNYAPVIRFLRASGHEPDQAQDLAHDFFAHVLEHRSLEGVDPERGRFRTYVLGALKHFAGKARERDSRLKRGGGLEAVPLEGDNETKQGSVPPTLRSDPPEALFDREWALGVVDRALAIVQQQCVAAGSGEMFETLKPWLSASATPGSQAEVAARLGMSEGAVKVAIHRLRKSFRQAVRNEVAQTVQDESEVAGEMQHLIAALSG